MMTRLLLALLAFYRRWLSPALHALSPGGCKYLPTCSEYAQVAIATHGPLRGSGLALWRLLRCHPFARGGLDPVPTAPGIKDRSLGVPAPPAVPARPFPHKPLP
jgi:putative membrane protein insertion efficiency factor